MRLLWLDLFRGLAAFAVVGYHYREYLGIDWIAWGYTAVEVFFVLSGLILGLIYTRKITSGMPFIEFVKARLFRLYPMIFISGVLILVLNFAGAPPNPYVPGDSSTPLDTFFVTPLTEQKGPGWPSNSPVWSLWAELACNVVWFWALRAGDRWAKIFGTLSMLATLILAHHFKFLGMGSDAGWDSRAISLVSSVAWFTAGYWLALRKIPPVAPMWVLLTLFLSTVIYYESGAAHSEWIAALLIVVAATLVINSLYQIQQPSRLVGRLCASLGSASFPLYLVHAPAGRLLTRSAGLSVHWLSFLLVIGTATVTATLLNQYCVSRLHSTRPGRGTART